MGPGDFATIYNTAPLLSGNPKIDGTGQTIAIVGETNINVKDVQDFRTMFGLPANFDATNVILNGEDPGITSRGEEGEADLDVEWSGAVAPGAIVKFVVSASTPASAGIDLSALYIVEHNLAGAMSESYGGCESGLGSAVPRESRPWMRRWGKQWGWRRGRWRNRRWRNGWRGNGRRR
jgi:subtilase family serine protease